MKKIILMAIGIIAILLLLGGAFYMYRINKNEKAVMRDDIVSFVYIRGGGELNAFYRISMEDNRLTIEQSEGNNSKTKKKKYKVSREVQASVKEIISNSKMQQWEKGFPYSEEEVLDGETTSVAVVFGDGTLVTFNSAMIIPDGGWEAVNEAVRILEAAAQ